MDLRDYIETQEVRRVGYRSSVVVAPDATVEAALAIMREQRVGCLLVAVGDDLKGIFTERDLLRKVLARDSVASVSDPISTVMTSDPVVAHEDEALSVLLSRMYSGGFRHLPLLSGKGTLLGTISIKRVIGFLADQFGEAVYNLPPRPEDFGTAREGG